MQAIRDPQEPSVWVWQDVKTGQCGLHWLQQLQWMYVWVRKDLGLLIYSTTDTLQGLSGFEVAVMD